MQILYGLNRGATNDQRPKGLEQPSVAGAQGFVVRRTTEQCRKAYSNDAQPIPQDLQTPSKITFMISKKNCKLYRMHQTRRSYLYLRIFALLGFGLSSIAIAEDEVSFQGSLVWQNYGTSNLLNNKNPQNPDNSVALIPNTAFDSRMLPDFQFRAKTFKLIFRPIISERWSQTRVESLSTSSKIKADAYINEAYAQWNASDSFLFAFGLQNFQWGPTESISPTNKIFRDSILSKDVFYESKGKYLSRANLSLGKNFNFILLSNVDQAPRHDTYRSEEVFETSVLAKAEANWNGGANYFGLAGGAFESGNPWFGEYFNLDIKFIDGLSIFGDVSHEKQPLSWYPVRRSIPGGPTTAYDLVTFEQSERDNNNFKTLAVGGLRYAFENGSDLRFEYIFNQLGYTNEQREDAYYGIDPTVTTQSPYLLVNSSRFFYPGIGLPGQKYGYASVRVPDFFTLNDLLFYGRFLNSLTDHSSYMLFAFEYTIGDAGTFIFSQAGSSGGEHSELQGLVTNSTTLGYKHVW